MLLLKSFRKPSRSVDDAPCGSHLSTPNVPLLSLRLRVYHPKTRIYVRLLGPCFKTGQITPFRQHPKVVYRAPNRCHSYRHSTYFSQVQQGKNNRSQGPSQKARPATPQSDPRRSLQAITLTTRGCKPPSCREYDPVLTDVDLYQPQVHQTNSPNERQEALTLPTPHGFKTSD